MDAGKLSNLIHEASMAAARAEKEPNKIYSARLDTIYRNGEPLFIVAPAALGYLAVDSPETWEDFKLHLVKLLNQAAGT